MGRGASLTFGKISLASEGESIKTLAEYLKNILKEIGYPTTEMEKGKKEEEDEEEEMSVKELKEIVKESKPASDSVMSEEEQVVKDADADEYDVSVEYPMDDEA